MSEGVLPGDAVFDDLAALAGRVLDAPYAFVTLVDDTRSFWTVRIGVLLDGPAQHQVEDAFCQHVVASGKPLIADDVTTHPLTASHPSIASLGVRAWAGFPLISPDGRPLGSFGVADTRVRKWSEADVEVLRVLSVAAGRELELRSTVQETAAADEHLTLLVQVGQALAETLDAAEAVARLARLVVPVLGDWSVVSLADEDGRLTDVGWWHARDDARPVLDSFAQERLLGLDGTGATNQVRRSQQPVVLDSGALEAGLDVLVSPRAREAYRTLDPAIYGVWPLAFAETMHGVIVIARDRGHEPFTAAEVDLAASIAHRAGTVLDNARLYARQQTMTEQLSAANRKLRDAGRHDRVVARALQEAMLTSLPEPDHLHLVARYLTADSADQVGGDWYDAVVAPGGATSLMIGDVSGHDIDAATVMGQLRNMLRTLVWEHESEQPSAVIARLDRAMRDLGVDTMTTLVLARIEQDPGDAAEGARTLRWSSAGHPAPVLIAADGTPTLLAGGPDAPLAVAADAPRRDHVTAIGPGATLLMYTDGLIETRTADLGARQSRLLDVLASRHDLALDELLDAVLHEMVGDRPDDDVALIAVRFHPEDRPRPGTAGPPNA